MILKRYVIKHAPYILALSLIAGFMSCSSDESEPAPSPIDRVPSAQTDGIALTIPLSSTRTGDDASSLIDKLSIVAYDEGGHLIETILKNGGFVKEKSGGETEFDNIEEIPGYGTVMSVMLPKEQYGQYTVDDRASGGHYGIKLVAFYLPDEGTKFSVDKDFDAPDNLNKLNSEIETYYTLTFPGVGENVWKPTDENQIPMSGALDITNAVCNYDPHLWNENNPLFLNKDPLVLIRSMAKVTIKSEDNFLTGAQFKTAVNGTLLPDLDHVVKDGADIKVDKATVPATEDFTTGFNAFQKINGEEDEYVFYTFERDLTDKAADDEARKLMKLSWGDEEKTFSFRNYTSGNLKDPVWQGILRNHSYTFTIKKPENGNIEVKVSVDKWESFDYDENI